MAAKAKQKVIPKNQQQITAKNEAGEITGEYLVPKELGALADHWYAVNLKRKEINREAEVLEKQEKAIKAWVIENVPRDERAAGVIGQVGMFQLFPDVIFTVEDKAKFHKYIEKHDAWDLLQGRLSEPAIRARVEDLGEKILPQLGLATFDTVKVSLKAAPKRK